MQSGRHEQARDHLRTLLDSITDPRQSVRTRFLLAEACVRLNDIAGAHDAIDPGLRAVPDATPLIAAKAGALLHERRTDEAATLLDAHIDSAVGFAPIAHHYARLCAQTGRADEGAARMRSWLDAADLDDESRKLILFALGFLLDKLERYDDAFDAYTRANALRAVRFNADAYEAWVDRTIAAWTADRVAALPKSTVTDQRPVFILGMPRSGTSLTEQILAAHPTVHAAGELMTMPTVLRRALGLDRVPGFPLPQDPSTVTPDALDSAARAYLDTIDALAHHAERVTDKLVGNYLGLPLIHAALPAARVVHLRRDPRDTCLSCFFQNFSVGLDYAFDLTDLARAHLQHDRIMDHWKRMLREADPAFGVIELAYADLVTDQAATTRRLLDSLGLPWSDACLRFHESTRITFTASVDQVAKPMYASSLGRWRRYEKHLAPLLDALGGAEPDPAPPPAS